MYVYNIIYPLLQKIHLKRCIEDLTYSLVRIVLVYCEGFFCGALLINVNCVCTRRPPRRHTHKLMIDYGFRIFGI